jgi:hypothetical protein
MKKPRPERTGASHNKYACISSASSDHLPDPGDILWGKHVLWPLGDTDLPVHATIPAHIPQQRA